MLEHIQNKQISDHDAKIIADQLRRVVETEKTGGYCTQRGSQDYVRALRGVRHTFAQVMGLGSRMVLDIGTGSAKALKQFQRVHEYRNLDFKATGLTLHPDVDENIGIENFVLTSAEVLRAIPDNSVGAAISVFSVTYSAAPEYVVDSIDRVLVEGGIFKAALRPTKKRFRQRKIRGMTILREMDAVNGSTYKQLFDDMGYDAHLAHARDRDVLLAIKPGNPTSPSAKMLYLAEYIA